MAEIEQSIDSEHLKRAVKIRVFLPPYYHLRRWQRHRLVFFNDGQDMQAVGLKDSLTKLLGTKQIHSTIVVAIDAGDRMQEYGTAGQPDYKKRGSKAAAYTAFVLKELLPLIRKQYRSLPGPATTAFAGFSLGALSALDIVWKQAETFGIAGVFSGALWWRSKPFIENDPDADRIIYDLLKSGKHQPGQRFWFQAGTADEDSDRNNNGIIDAIDDTLDTMAALKALGYSKEAIRYVEVKGGEHNPQTWAKVLPDFLCFAFGK